MSKSLANEKITGAYYVMGESYSPADMTTSVLAVCADKQAYEKAKKDFERGKITKEELQDFTFIAHRYLPMAKKEITDCLNGVSHSETGEEALEYRRLLTESAGAEINSMVNALNGIPVWPGSWWRSCIESQCSSYGQEYVQYKCRSNSWSEGMG